MRTDTVPICGRPALGTPALAVVGLLAGGAALCPVPASAQYLPSYFPTSVPGYGEQLGVTVVSRPRPLYEEAGVHVGDFIVRTDLDESTGYNSNVVGLKGGPGSWEVETQPSISLNSDWSRNALGASISIDNVIYPEAANQNVTNYTVALGGSYTIGRGDLTLAYSHLAQHENPTDFGAPPSSVPIPYNVNDFRAEYTFNLGRLKITPNAEYSQFQYGSTAISGKPMSESSLNHAVIEAGSAFRYEFSGKTSLLIVAEGVESSYVAQPHDAPSLSSTSGLVLSGIDYLYDGVWRYQLLLGAEERSFVAPQFKTQLAPIAQGTAIWTPSGLTTVTGTLVRTIQDPVTSEGAGFIYTSAQLRVDHEYLRNVLLDTESGVESASYITGGTQDDVKIGGGITWLMNPYMRLSAHYQFTTRGGPPVSLVQPSAVSTLVSGAYKQSLFLVTLHLGL